MKVKLMMLVKEADEEVNEVAQFESDGFIFVAELMNCHAKDFEMGKEYEVDLSCYCHAIYGVYKTYEEFQKEHNGMAKESFIPVGAFPASEKHIEEWKPSPMNYINSVVKDVVDNEIYQTPENYILFHGKVLDKTLDQILYYENIDEKDVVEPGYIVSGLYWIELTKEE